MIHFSATAFLSIQLFCKVIIPHSKLNWSNENIFFSYLLWFNWTTLFRGLKKFNIMIG